jgi:hypothetical protein
MRIMSSVSLTGDGSCVNSAGAVCDQKTSKFFVSHWEEAMARHMGVKEVY